MSRTRKRRGQRPVPPAVEAVGERIEAWRTTRARRTHMPEELWASAAAVAREHGLWFVSRCLRVNYESLKKRLVAGQPEGGPVSEFVELPTSPLVCQPSPLTAVVEVSRVDGARLMIRLEGQGAALDVESLAAAFWQGSR